MTVTLQGTEKYSKELYLILTGITENIAAIKKGGGNTFKIRTFRTKKKKSF